RDPRLQVALESAGYGLTQTLAAAPQLVARWEDAQTAAPYAGAVLTAALDVARLGARAPLSAEFLRAAAVDYCTSSQPAEAPQCTPAGAARGRVWVGGGLAHGQAARRPPPPCAGPGRQAPALRLPPSGLPAPARQPETPACPRAPHHLGRRLQSHPRPR